MRELKNFGIEFGLTCECGNRDPYQFIIQKEKRIGNLIQVNCLCNCCERLYEIILAIAEKKIKWQRY